VRGASGTSVDDVPEAPTTPEAPMSVEAAAAAAGAELIAAVRGTVDALPADAGDDAAAAAEAP
jgi:hypothetical protein